jgi:stage V sporulation protein AE
MEWIKCFIVGGLFCLIAQIIIDKTNLTPARILVGYVCLGVVLTGIGIYRPIVEFAHCGATVPLTGFGFSLANGVKEAVDQYGFWGIFFGGLSATSGGIAAAITFSLIFSVLFSGKPENL